MSGKLSAAYILVSVMMLLSCNDRPEKPFDTGKVKSKDTSVNVTAAAHVIYSYLNLKEALVADNAASANRHADTMSRYIDTLASGILPSEDTLILTQKREIFLLKNDLNTIVSESGYEKQRVAFKSVSDNLARFIKDYRLEGLQLYHFYCPMAFNETGAWWFSHSPEVRNPYFGTKMLTCGERVDTIQ